MNRLNTIGETIHTHKKKKKKRDDDEHIKVQRGMLEKLKKTSSADVVHADLPSPLGVGCMRSWSGLSPDRPNCFAQRCIGGRGCRWRRRWAGLLKAAVY